MKSFIIFKSIALVSLFILLILPFVNVNAENNPEFREAACPITINFCINGAGSGHQITIYSGGDCTGSVLTTLTTGSNGCASYTFTSGCDRLYTVQETTITCPSVGQCSYFEPEKLGNNYNYPVYPCK